MDNVLLWNGRVIPVEQRNLLVPDTWSRYAAGFYESIKVSNGQLVHWQAHYERMMRGAAYWKLDLPGQDELQTILNQLIRQSPCSSGKLRIQFGIDTTIGQLQYLAELEELSAGYSLNANGWEIGIYRADYKAYSRDSDHKTNRRDIYVKAGVWMNKQQLNEAVIMNKDSIMADGTFTNLYWIKDDVIYTPSLQTGCLPGVMRQFLLNHASLWKISIQSVNCRSEILETADEIFLTNAIRGIRWVGRLHGKTYSNSISSRISEQLSNWLIQQS